MTVLNEKETRWYTGPFYPKHCEFQVQDEIDNSINSQDESFDDDYLTDDDDNEIDETERDEVY